MTEKQIKDLKNSMCEIVWLDDPWTIDSTLHSKANKAAKWNFDWNYSEACQFT